jgi:hypothetical protein
MHFRSLPNDCTAARSASRFLTVKKTAHDDTLPACLKKAI